jgi:hypothetical protein
MLRQLLRGAFDFQILVGGVEVVFHLSGLSLGGGRLFLLLHLKESLFLELDLLLFEFIRRRQIALRPAQSAGAERVVEKLPASLGVLLEQGIGHARSGKAVKSFCISASGLFTTVMPFILSR